MWGVCLCRSAVMILMQIGTSNQRCFRICSFCDSALKMTAEHRRTTYIGAATCIIPVERHRSTMPLGGGLFNAVGTKAAQNHARNNKITNATKSSLWFVHVWVQRQSRGKSDKNTQKSLVTSCNHFPLFSLNHLTLTSFTVQTLVLLCSCFFFVSTRLLSNSELSFKLSPLPPTFPPLYQLCFALASIAQFRDFHTFCTARDCVSIFLWVLFSCQLFSRALCAFVSLVHLSPHSLFLSPHFFLTSLSPPATSPKFSRHPPYTNLFLVLTSLRNLFISGKSTTPHLRTRCSRLSPPSRLN